MILAPVPVQQFFDDNGLQLIGGKLFCYQAGTTTKQACFTDSSGAVPLANPIILNARGEVAPSIFGQSVGLWMDPTLAYKFVLAPADDSDPPTHSFWTVDNVVSPSAAVLAQIAAYNALLGGVPVGAMMAYGGAAAPAGWLLCFGQAVSRTTYSALFAVLGTSYGAGDGSTTFNVPDKRGRISVGKDDMGGSAANRVTNAVCGITGTALGASGGDQHAQPDSPTVTTSISTSLTDPGHFHFITFGTTGGGSTQLAIDADAPLQTASLFTQNATTGITISVTGSTSFTSALTGTAQNMPPAQVDNWIIRAGV